MGTTLALDTITAASIQVAMHQAFGVSVFVPSIETYSTFDGTPLVSKPSTIHSRTWQDSLPSATLTLALALRKPTKFWNNIFFSHPQVSL